jgi:hypothetical protein
MQSPVDVAIVAGVVLLIFGPKSRPPWCWKIETNERKEERKCDPFRKEKIESFLKEGVPDYRSLTRKGSATTTEVLPHDDRLP